MGALQHRPNYFDFVLNAEIHFTLLRSQTIISRRKAYMPRTDIWLG
jgi:hypothetical protein